MTGKDGGIMLAGVLDLTAGRRQRPTGGEIRGSSSGLGQWRLRTSACTAQYLLCVALAVVALTAAISRSGEAQAGPVPDCADDCKAALTALIAAGATPLPAGTPCSSGFIDTKPPTVADLLALELAEFSRGRNVDRRRCRLRILHRFGEDVSSMDLRFTLRHSRLDIGSLECFMTP